MAMLRADSRNSLRTRVATRSPSCSSRSSGSRPSRSSSPTRRPTLSTACSVFSTLETSARTVAVVAGGRGTRLLCVVRRGCVARHEEDRRRRRHARKRGAAACREERAGRCVRVRASVLSIWTCGAGRWRDARRGPERFRRQCGLSKKRSSTFLWRTTRARGMDWESVKGG
ncbi:unnamed protein product, partial [Scytosiphon promiscuus]